VNAPAVLLEGFFVDNKADASGFDSVSEQKEMAAAYAKGVLDYLGVNAGPDEIDITIQNAMKDIKLVQPDLWEDVLRGRKTATPVQVKALMDKYHAAVEKR
jgi:DNA-binding NarL/FixJ family response regulator